MATRGGRVVARLSVVTTAAACLRLYLAADAVEAEVAVAHAQIAEARRTGAIDEEAAAVAWAAA